MQTWKFISLLAMGTSCSISLAITVGEPTMAEGLTAEQKKGSERCKKRL